MQLKDFNYYLPQEQIAQSPAEPRDSSKLLVLDRNNGQMQDKVFSDIAELL
jgi:S-adenosylmethionine:tRNA ribosyltransferase-isomerase